MLDGLKKNHSAVPNCLIQYGNFQLPMKPISYCGLGLLEGLALRKKYPSDFNRPFARLVHSRIGEHYVRTSDDLSVLGVPESVSDLAVWTIAKENAFLGSRFEFSVVVFWYEGIRLATENPQLVVIRLFAGPYFLRYN